MEIIRCANQTHMADQVAGFFRDLAQRALREKGWWSLALCGGMTPRHLYERLSCAEYARGIAWSATHIFFGDERCVPPTHEASNYRMAWDLFLSRVLPPETNVHRIRGECTSADDEARRYEEDMKAFFMPREGGIAGGFPVFDLIVLGIGPDGHTASLFPGDPMLEERERWAVAVVAPHGYEPPRRITMTLPVINHAKNVFFLVAGARKAAVFRDILNTPDAARIRYPAARVRARERTVWFVDADAVGI